LTLLKVPAIVLLLVWEALAKSDGAACGTYPERAMEEIALSRLHQQQREVQAALRKMAGLAVAEARRGASRDIGNIAILEENAGIISRRNVFNLNRRLLRFLPASSGYRVENAPSAYNGADERDGALIAGIGDDDTRPQALPFSFPYFGRSYSNVFLNSDGNLTFEAGDGSSRERSLGRFLSGVPRIAAVFTDLDPTRGGTIRVLSRADRFVVSWTQVPLYVDFGFGALNTFQLRLYPSGVVEFDYEDVNATAAVVGISPGSLLGNAALVRYENVGSDVYRGAIAERFTTTEELDTVTAAQRFYETHEDAYDYLVFYNALGITAGQGVIAFEVTVRNQRTGYGDTIVEAGREYGSARRLQAVLNMGPVSQYPLDPDAILPARFSARDTPITVLAHEAGHLFLAFASVRDPNNPTLRPMLGRQTAHWAFNFNSEASIMEGNRILDRGIGVRPRFETVAVTEQFSPLDQYLMGLRGKEEVGPLFYVANSGINPLFPPPPQVGRLFDGDRRDVSVDDLIAEHGRRTPDHTVSQKRFRFAFVLVAPVGFTDDAAVLGQLETYRERFEGYYFRAASQRAQAEVSLRRELNVSLWPASGVLLGSAVNGSVGVARALNNPLTVRLASTNGSANVPESVVIPAGQTRATFVVRGVRVGVDTIEASPVDAAFERVTANVQVLASAERLRLRLESGNGQMARAFGPLLQPLVLRVVDENNLPYPGIRVIASPSGNGTVTPGSQPTGEDGRVSFSWMPAEPPLNSIRFSIDGVPVGVTSVVATTQARPFLLGNGVRNAANLTNRLTPYALHTLFGTNLAAGVEVATSLPWPLQVNEVTVNVNGRPQPILFLNDGQINFYLEDQVLGTSATVEVVTPLGRTGPVNVPLTAVNPGIFFDPITGIGAARRVGNVLEIYGTGLGPVTQRDGEQLVDGRVEVRINGAAAEVVFAGLAPGFVGLYQVNARVTPGGELRVRLIVDGIEGNEVLVR
jgi:uncharacterized protein (TIGR03437 family)